MVSRETSYALSNGFIHKHNHRSLNISVSFFFYKISNVDVVTKNKLLVIKTTTIQSGPHLALSMVKIIVNFSTRFMLMQKIEWKCCR